MWVTNSDGVCPVLEALDHHEAMWGPQHGKLHARACTPKALGAMAGVAPHVLLVQGHQIALEIKAVIGPSLREYATATEIAIREATHDIFMLDHDISLYSFTVSGSAPSKTEPSE